jgi:hypothetical protein
VIEGEFEDTEGAESVGFSHSDFCFVVQAFNDAAGEQLLGAEIVEDQLCGEAVGATGPKSTSSELEWVEIHDDTCTWYEFDDGREPIAVMRCNRCGSHPDVDGDGVVCPLCRNRSPSVITQNRPSMIT